jgi:beta-lactamase regulating signal transducer with metallopeptidase domain
VSPCWLLAILLGTSLKAAVVFLVVLLAARLMREGPPSLRHLLWLAAIGSYPLILLLSLIGPRLQLVQPQGLGAPTGISRTVAALLLPQGGPSVSAGPDASVFGMAETGWRQGAWAFPGLMVWVAGTLASLPRVAVGGIRLRRLVVEARRRAAREGPALGGQHFRKLRAMAAGRKVHLLQSPDCRVPFTGGILRPFIMLPLAARAWPLERLRAVLLHELRHVERWDYLTQAMARWICSLFWFMPLSWIACSFLYAEQEKACDAGVMEGGVAPGAYAACILKAARLCPQPAPLAGLCPPSWRKRVLEDRIRQIVEGGRALKKRWLVFTVSVFVVSVLVVVGGCLSAQPHFAASPVHVPEWNEELYGTWVNLDYPGNKDFAQKWSLYRYGVFERYYREGSAAAERRRTFFFIEKWQDAEGNVWYTTNEMGAGATTTYFVLYRISKGGSVLETVWSTQGYPRPGDLEPENGKYRIMYRK